MSLLFHILPEIRFDIPNLSQIFLWSFRAKSRGITKNYSIRRLFGKLPYVNVKQESLNYIKHTSKNTHTTISLNVDFGIHGS